MANPRGRQPIGLNQPPGGGTNYPFVSPSSDIEYLIGDLFVSFDDLDDQIVYPLRVAWLYGFGAAPSLVPGGFPTPTHSQDIIIKDANDVTVFDSTTASSFKTDTWDSRLEIFEWENDDNVLRCTRHTEWTQADIDDGLDKTYALYITPTNGVLQADTWYKMPKRLLSLQVGLTNVAKTRVRLEEGYNMALEYLNTSIVPELTLPSFDGSKQLVPGTRNVNRISLIGDPGGGLGVFPGCVDAETFLRTVNRVPGNDYQNFFYDSEGCLRSQRPVGLLDISPREFEYASFPLSKLESSSAIEMLNDCINCCDCEYFAQTYQGIKRQWFLYQDVATTAEQARDTYSDNRDRWLAQKAIREADTVRVRASIDGNCKISWGFAHCNASKCCITGVEAHMTWLYYLNGVLVAPTKVGYDCLKTEIDGSAQCDGPEQIVIDLDDTGRYGIAVWDYSDPQTVTTVQGRQCFPDCADVEAEALKVRLHVYVRWENSSTDPSTDEACEYPLLVADDFPADVKTTWAALGVDIPTDARAQKLSPLLTTSDANPYCERCPCTEGDVSFG